MSLKSMRAKLEQQKGVRKHLKGQLKETELKAKRLRKKIEYADEALVLIQKVAKETQDNLVFHINELVTLAMSAVFDDPYEFTIDFTPRRGKTEADIYFVRNKKKIDPIYSAGGGAVDISAFGLRSSIWSLREPRNRPVLVLDEPLTRLKGKTFPQRGAQMIKEVSKALGIQIIMVSHDPTLIDTADKVFHVDITKIDGWKISEVSDE